MSIFSNVTEQDLNILRKLVEQQKNQRAEKINKRILKQTHDIKLSESLSPITKKLDEVNKSTQKISDVIKESQPQTPQLAIENTQNPQPIESNEGVLYDDDLENTLKNMTTNTGFFKTYCDRKRGWLWNGHPVKMLDRSEVEINNKNYNVTQGIQNVFTQTSIIPLKKLNTQEREINNNLLETLDFENYKPESAKSKFGRYKQLKSNFNKRNLQGRGFEKIIIPSNIIDIYTRLEILLGLKLSGHTDTLTEASNLIDELYKRREIQNKQQYRNAPNNFSTIKMELPSKLLEQISFNTRPKLEEHMLVVMYKSTHEEHLFQPLQTNNE